MHGHWVNIVIFELRTGTCEAWRGVRVPDESPQGFQVAGCGIRVGGGTREACFSAECEDIRVKGISPKRYGRRGKDTETSGGNI